MIDGAKLIETLQKSSRIGILFWRIKFLWIKIHLVTLVSYPRKEKVAEIRTLVAISA